MPVDIKKSVPLSERTIRRLKGHAIPLEDDYDSVVARLLDYFEAQKAGKPARVPTLGKATASGVRPPPEYQSLERSFNPLAPPSLTHTKITSASFNGRSLEPPSWNGLLDEAVRTAAKRLKSFADVRKISQMNIANGKKTDEGYHYLSEADMSVQGQDANDAWRCAVYIARVLRCPIDVHFLWRAKEAAAYPGESGYLSFEGVLP